MTSCRRAASARAHEHAPSHLVIRHGAESSRFLPSHPPSREDGGAKRRPHHTRQTPAARVGARLRPRAATALTASPFTYTSPFGLDNATDTKQVDRNMLGILKTFTGWLTTFSSRNTTSPAVGRPRADCMYGLMFATFDVACVVQLYCLCSSHNNTSNSILFLMKTRQFLQCGNPLPPLTPVRKPPPVSAGNP
jgi:hypothetical protein